MQWERAGQTDSIAVMLEYSLASVRECGNVFSLGTAVVISDFASSDVLAWYGLKPKTKTALYILQNNPSSVPSCSSLDYRLSSRFMDISSYKVTSLLCTTCVTQSVTQSQITEQL